MLKDAEPYHIDQDVVAAAQKEIQRLNAQRNLRFEIDNIDTSVGMFVFLCSDERWCC